MDIINESLELLDARYKLAIQETQSHAVQDQVRSLQIKIVCFEQVNENLQAKLNAAVDREIAHKMDLEVCQNSLHEHMHVISKLKAELKIKNEEIATLQNLLKNQELVKGEHDHDLDNIRVNHAQAEREIKRLNAEIKGLRSAENDYLDYLQEKTIMSRKILELTARLENGEESASQLKVLKSNTKVLEQQIDQLTKSNELEILKSTAKLKELEKQVSELQKEKVLKEKEQAKERDTVDRADKKEFKEIEKKFNNQITQLKAQLTRQTSLKDKAERELLKSKNQVHAKTRMSATGLNDNAEKKDAEGNQSLSLLFTPREKIDHRNAKRNAKPENLLEKSAFSMTPFLRRQANTKLLSPAGAPSQNSGPELLAGKRVPELTAADKSVSSRDLSLAALVQEDLENGPAKEKKKKRKLGVARGLTLIDQDDDEDVKSERTARLAAPVAQRAFLSGKEISPLKNSNQNIRDMFRIK
ncbi:hypothetical protein V1514DRAFT_182703 [Lipomyces japonicus]|uniref:uncharacterized protein n=1 Tax=Lipomyces japonicus TaxID=56871 RepID=UPI0034CD5ED5